MEHTFTIQQYLVFFGCILLGQTFHLVIKANSLKKKNILLGKPFKIVDDFLRVDSLEIVGALLAGIICMVAYSELVGFYPKLGMAQKLLFILIGYTGSSLVLAWLSKADKAANKAIKENTTLVDDILKNQNDKTMEEFVITYESNTDQVKDHNGLPETIDNYAEQTGGVHNSTAKEIVYDTEPANVTFVRLDTTTYIAVPIRRPK